MTINVPIKAEVILCRGPWRNFGAFEGATIEWVDWFNSRLLAPIGSISLPEAEANFLSALKTEDMAT